MVLGHRDFMGSRFQYLKSFEISEFHDLSEAPLVLILRICLLSEWFWKPSCVLGQGISHKIGTPPRTFVLVCFLRKKSVLMMLCRDTFAFALGQKFNVLGQESVCCTCLWSRYGCLCAWPSSQCFCVGPGKRCLRPWSRNRGLCAWPRSQCVALDPRRKTPTCSYDILSAITKRCWPLLLDWFVVASSQFASRLVLGFWNELWNLFFFLCFLLGIRVNKCSIFKVAYVSILVSQIK